MSSANYLKTQIL